MNLSPLQRLSLAELLPARLSDDEKAAAVESLAGACETWLALDRRDRASGCSRAQARAWAEEVTHHARALVALLSKGEPHRVALENAETILRLATAAELHAAAARETGGAIPPAADVVRFADGLRRRDLLKAARPVAFELAEVGATMAAELSRPGPDSERAEGFVHFMASAWWITGLGRAAPGGVFGRFIRLLGQYADLTVSPRTIAAGLRPTVETPEGRVDAMRAAASKHGARIRKLRGFR